MEINREMLLQSFREETEECLAQMEQSLLALETHPDDRELISSLFRAAHTVKGNASLLVINTLLEAVDALRQMAKRAADAEEGLLPEHEALSARLADVTADFKMAETPRAQESSPSSLPDSSAGST